MKQTTATPTTNASASVKQSRKAQPVSDTQNTLTAAQAKREQAQREKQRAQAQALQVASQEVASWLGTPFYRQAADYGERLDAIKTSRQALVNGLFTSDASSDWSIKVHAFAQDLRAKFASCATPAYTDAFILCGMLASAAVAGDKNACISHMTTLARRMPSSSKTAPALNNMLRGLKALASGVNAVAFDYDADSAIPALALANLREAQAKRDARQGETLAKARQAQAAMLKSAKASNAKLAKASKAAKASNAKALPAQGETTPAQVTPAQASN